MIATATLIICSLTLITIAVYPLYSALMARIMDRRLAEKEPLQYGKNMYRSDQTQIVESAMEQNEAMISCIRNLIFHLEWALEQAETLLEEPDDKINSARAGLKIAQSKYGE